MLVEHGLDHTAVISFLHSATSFSQLSYLQQRALISLSYNNLVDWHLLPDRHGLLRVYNRSKPLQVEYVSLSEHSDAFRAEAFDRVVGRRPNPNLPALDDALLSTVARWRRLLASECGLATDTTPIAELFNTIFFVRALEDDRRNRNGNSTSTLLNAVEAHPETPLHKLLVSFLEQLAGQSTPEGLLDIASLRVFDSLGTETALELLSDFYENRFAPYAYDFSLMSKHALSRIYERYISILRPVDVIQQTLFGPTESVSETDRKDLGEVYTPQYIARFFARFLHESTTPPKFRALRAIDPACGSGIFLRTLLEAQCDPMNTRDLDATADKAFASIHGIDIEPNACKATRLSLCLLHLVLTGRFPSRPLQIECQNAIAKFTEPASIDSVYDAVIANPPFVRWESIPHEWHTKIREFLGGDVKGRPDLYLAFIQIALKQLSPRGFLLFVLPHAFLIADNAKQIRKRLAKEFWIRHLVDLSALNVFEGASSYPILLIAERRDPAIAVDPPAFVTKCSGYAGHALQAALDERQESTAFYTVHRVDQEAFGQSAWRILSPQDYELSKQLSSLPRLDGLFRVEQGVNSGCDRVFIRDRHSVPAAECEVYSPLLRDREMQRYRVPDNVATYVFYPFEGDRLLTEKEIRTRAPETWKYLESHYDQLSGRRSVQRGDFPWWRPERPRVPSRILRPKIVGPHLMLFPKFAIDFDGEYVVSRTPFISHESNDKKLLWYLLAVLNSSLGHWQIAMQSHKYSRGYARLEAATLRDFKMPQPAAINPRLLSAIVEHSERAISVDSREVDQEIDELVAKAYGVDLSSLPETSMQTQ
ncbi:MAG: SAM-dependent DNA methyltransferase [Candidatus Nealsonbacteria bacterium]|nr:SAM-dependent DNA methyltransferase [Candidatus Nealsonbacteria bacterium]